MDTIHHTHAPLAPRRRIGAVIAAVVVAVVVVAVFAGVSRLVGDPAVVDHLEIRNPTADIVDVTATGGGDQSTVAVATLEPHSRIVVDDVIDQGDTWVLGFRVSGRTVGEIRTTRAGLERAQWRVTVPTSAAAPATGPPASAAGR